MQVAACVVHLGKKNLSLMSTDVTCKTQERRTNTESRFSRVMKLFVRGSAVWLICCSSHAIGASAALKIFFTASAISGPMPSPGNSVAVMGVWLLKSLRRHIKIQCWSVRFLPQPQLKY